MRVLRTFSKSRMAPAENVSASRSSAWKPFTTRTPPKDSVRRPETSALITLRSRKIGCMMPKALLTRKPNTPRKTSVARVSVAFILISRMKATSAVINPPSSSTSPVPTRLRTPSASDMMRDTRAPVLLAS